MPIVEDFNAKIAENAAKVAEQKAGHATAVSDTLAENRAATKTASRVEGVERSVEEGSKELGSRVKNLDAWNTIAAAKSIDAVDACQASGGCFQENDTNAFLIFQVLGPDMSPQGPA